MKGQRTMAVMVMMVLVVLGMMMGQVRAEVEACMQQLEHMRATNQTKVLAVMLDATGKAWNDLGKWDECKDLGAHISHYCTVSYKIPGGTSDSLTGFCLPSDCTVSDISTDLTGTAVMDLDHYINWKLHNYTFFPPVVTILRDVDATLGKVANFTEHLKFDSVCSPPTPSIWSRPGAVVMIVLSLVIGIIVIMGTLLDGYDANWWPEPDTTVSSPQLGGIQDTAEVQPLLAPKGVHQRRSKLFDFFVAFSVARNFKSLVGPSPPGLAFLNGMRAISISWVILGHSLDYMNYAGVLNFAHVIVKDSKHGSAQVFPGAEFSVDSFFWLSGFLVTYLTVKELKTKKRVNCGLDFTYVWRLSPAYFYALFFYMFVSVGISDGPMWPEYMEKVDQTCGKYWWTNLVYVNNFIPANNWQGQCFLWGWYLAVDMQLCIFRMFGDLKNKFIGWALVLILTVGSVVANGVIAHIEHLQWNALDPHVYMSMVYGKPYTRAAPWLLGIACAFLYLEKKQLQRIVVYVGWAVSAVIMALCIYGPTHQYIGGGSILEMGTFKNTWGSGSKAWTYFTFSKLGWSLAVSFLMYSMAMGWGGFVRRFLGAHMWSPLARLTYSAYLFHPIIIYFSYDHFYMGVIYVGMLVLSFSTAVVMFLAIERPMTNMEKLFLPHKK